MSLGRTYRFNIFNNTGQTIPANKININARRWLFSATGQQTFEGSPAAILSSNTSLTNGSYLSTSNVDNSVSAWLGGTFEIDIDMTASAGVPNGPVIIYLQRSHDGGTTWPDAGNGLVVKIFNFTQQNKQVDTFEI